MNISQLKLNLHLILLANRSHRSPVVTGVVVPVHAAQIEVQVIGVVAAARVKRTRPIVAVVACIVEIAIVAIARRRKKYGVTVLFTCYFISCYSVLSGPRPSAI